MPSKTTEPGGIAQWFSREGASPVLIGSRCAACGVFYFPPNLLYCRNPDCDSEDLQSLELSSQGPLWSFSKQHYPPPPPFVTPENPAEFEPYIVAAVELQSEKMIVLGHLARGFSEQELELGMPMRLVVEPLQDVSGEPLAWKWRPGEG